MFASTKVLIFSDILPFFGKYQQRIFLLHYLTFGKTLIYRRLRKSYKNDLKKNKKNDTPYQKNAYLCSVLMNK